MSDTGISPRLPDLTHRLTALYSAACAPLSSSTLLMDLQDLSANDFVLPTAVEELRYVDSVSKTGFQLFINAFELLRVPGAPTDASPKEALDTLNKAPETMVALLAAANFARRMALLCTQLSHMCTNTVERSLTGDPTVLLKTIEERVKKCDRTMFTEEEKALEACFDFTPHTQWGHLEVPMKNKVEFKTTTAVISEGRVEEHALKGGEFRRKKQRNPTGYHKFNFKDLEIGDSDFDSECRPSRVSSARGTGALSTDGESTRGSLSYGGGGFVGGANGATTGGGLTSRSASSIGEETGDEYGHESLLPQRNSSVLFSFEAERQVIQDDVADPQWEEQQRHQRRFSRIRNRVPTGHPAIMRDPSSDLAEIVNEYEKKLSDLRIDNETAENTEINKRVPPSIQREEEKEKSPRSEKRTVSMAHDA